MSEYRSPYAPEHCFEEGHVPGCAGAAGGEHELLTNVVPLSYLRCSTCGHKLDSFGGCDSCASDLAALPEDTDEAERVNDYWQRAMRPY